MRTAVALLLLALTVASLPLATADVEPRYATFIGTAASDNMVDVAVDAAGNGYVVWQGATGSTSQTFVEKYDATGARAWSYAFNGAGSFPVALAVDGTGSVVVAGTSLVTMPEAANGWKPWKNGPYDGYVLKFTPNGALAWGSMIGGNAYEWMGDVDVDDQGHVYVHGQTNSCDFTTTFNAFQRSIGGGCSEFPSHDTFLTKFDRDGKFLHHSTFLGGSGYEDHGSIAVSRSSGSVLVAGYTQSTDLPTTSGAYQRALKGFDDAFVLKLKADGSGLLFGTYLGGSEQERPSGIARDASSNVYVTGTTDSTDFPTTAGAHQSRHAGGLQCSEGTRIGWIEHMCPDAFVTKLDASGTSLRYSTFVGGQGVEIAEGIAVDSSGAAYVTGRTNSSEFLAVDGRSPEHPYNNAFAVALTPKGNALAYATSLGGAGGAEADAVAVASDGTATYVGDTTDPSFPTTSDARRRTAEGGEGWLVRMPPPTAGVVFAPYDGGEWWVQTALGGREANEVAKVEARDTNGPWVTLQHQPWGAWAASFRVEPGHAVTYRVTLSSGAVRESCAYAHPTEACASGGAFDATFSDVKGNAWWVETRVSGNEPVSSVHASVNGGAWRTLTLRSWGAWAASFSMPEGSIVQLRATSSSGATDLSGCHRWTAATLVACDQDPGTGFDATFRNVRGNEWWVETDASATGGTIAGIDARVNGGAWVELTKQSWGSWAKSIHAPAGSTVELRARSTDGQTDVSSAYRWPPG